MPKIGRRRQDRAEVSGGPTALTFSELQARRNGTDTGDDDDRGHPLQSGLTALDNPHLLARNYAAHVHPC